MEPSKPDVTLSDGRQISIDLNRITIREYRELIKPNQPDEEEYALVGKVCGMSAEEAGGLGQNDYRRLIKALMVKATEPLADPT